jgi:hypothetical protein
MPRNARADRTEGGAHVFYKKFKLSKKMLL